MADGTVRGAFELRADQPIRDLGRIRDLGAAADTSLANLGRRMDALGGATANAQLDTYQRKLESIGTTAENVTRRVSTSWETQRRTIDENATIIEARIDRLIMKLDEYGSKNVTASVDLSGFETVNLKLAEIEARLSRINGQTARARVAVSSTGGGGLSSAATGGADRGGGSNLFSTLGGVGGKLPWWAMLAPIAPALGGSAVSLVGSAGSALAGAGAVGLGALGTLGVGAGLTQLVAKPAIGHLSQYAKAVDAQQQTVLVYGANSRQAQVGQMRINAMLANTPQMAPAAVQGGLLVKDYAKAALPAQNAFYAGAANIAYDVRRAIPTVGPLEQTAVSTTMGSANTFAKFLTGNQGMDFMRTMTGSFAQNLPIAEHSLQNIATIFMHLSTDALPFFHQANLWVANWTAGMALSTGNTQRVSTQMGSLVSSAKDWARLTGAVFRTLKDLAQMGSPQGNSLVVDLTKSFDKWDTWIRNNPQKISGFFTQAATTTGHIATTIKNLVGDIWQIAHMLMPLMNQVAGGAQLLSTLGGGNLLLGGAAVYGGYKGATRALGGGGGGGGSTPSAGAVLRSVATGSPGPLFLSAARQGGGTVVGGPQILPLVAGAGGSAAAARMVSAGSGAMVSAVSDAELRAQAWAARSPLSKLGSIVTLETTRGAVGGAVSSAAGLVTGDAAARAAASEALGGAGRALSTAAAGAARFVGPMLAINALFTGMSAHGGVLDRVGASLSALTLGIAPPDLLKRAFGTTPTGASLQNPNTQRGIAGLQRQLSTDTTSRQFLSTAQQIQAAVHLTWEMPPDQARKLNDWIRGATDQALKSAGSAASLSWQDAFTKGIDSGTKPQKAVTSMLANMSTQLKTLGPKGALSFAQSTGQWAAQMEAANPKLRAPLQRLMRGITDDLSQLDRQTHTTMSKVRDSVVYYNGEILTGSADQWKTITYDMTNKLQVAQEKMAGSFSTILGEANGSLQALGFSQAQAKQIIAGLTQGGQNAANAQASVTGAQQGLGASSPLTTTAPAGLKKHATGGVISGSGLLDTVGMPDGSRAAPGEAWIANRHTMKDLSLATLTKYGKTAWEMIRDETRPHSAPQMQPAAQEGILPGYALGGQLVGQSIGGAAGRASASAAGGSLPMMIAKANEITSHHYPYLWGGGHNSSFSGPYDCSGAVSAVLHSGGLLSSPEVSGQFMSYGMPGPGEVTLYANPSHVYMSMAGRYFGTSTSNPGGGAAWFNGSPRPGFVQRHIPVTGSAAGIGAASGSATGALGGQQVSLHGIRSGLPGYPGAMADRGSAIYAAGLQQKINARLGSMTGGAAGGMFSGAGFTGGGSSAANQALGREMMLATPWHWGADQWPSLQALWTQESGWNQNARNPSSGAQGIPQALGHGDIGSSPTQQIAWGLNYIHGRYGSPAAAEQHERAFNWYQRGGQTTNWAGWHARGGQFLTNGPTLFGAGEGGKREHVSITPLGSSSAGGHHIVVKMENVHLSAQRHEIEVVAEAVAQKILEALDRVGQGATDAQLMGAAT